MFHKTNTKKFKNIRAVKIGAIRKKLKEISKKCHSQIKKRKIAWKKYNEDRP